MEAKGLIDKVSEFALRGFLDIGGEGDSWDFKLDLDLNSKPVRIELVRDIVALATTPGGGHLLVGFDPRTYEPVGMPAERTIDTTEVYNAIQKYVGGISVTACSYRLPGDSWKGNRQFGIIYVSEADTIPFTKREGSYEVATGRMEIVFREGDTFIRRGAQTIRATSEDVMDMARRLAVLPPDDHRGTTALPCALPPREDIVGRFVGRADEINTLWAWFRDPRQSRWLLTGYGGKGKSSIAYEFATRVVDLAPEGFYTVIWLSAKLERFAEGASTTVEVPDFWDMSSLLDAIVRGYGWADYAELELADRQDKVYELLIELPCLLVVDDVNSLARENEGAVDFLVTAVTRSPSKLLLTGRRVPYGWSTCSTEVLGLPEPDAQKFIDTRIEQYRLDPAAFTGATRRKVMTVTDRSPLYMEDLVRLCAVLPPHQAIERWREKGGDAAREYAISKEFETLEENAQRVVVACCLNDGPISFPELQKITRLNDDDLVQELREIQNLFLMSTARLSPDVARFDIDSNTRSLVLRVLRGTDLLEEVTRSFRSVSGELEHDKRTNRRIAHYVRQSSSLQQLGREEDAVETIRAGIAALGEDPDLIGQMGILYARRRPRPALTEAREWFGRAAVLRCSRETVYTVWTNMEFGGDRWDAAAAAAEHGIEMCGTTPRLCYLSGLSNSLRGQKFLREFQVAKAQSALLSADERLRAALRDPEALGSGEYELNARVLRALTINCEALHRTETRQGKAAGAQLADAFAFADRWAREYPRDRRATETGGWLRQRYRR